MTAGRVRGLQPLLPVTLRLPGRPDLTVEFVVDTGFVGFLTLPPAAVAALGLPFLLAGRELVVQCAEGGMVTVDAL